MKIVEVIKSNFVMIPVVASVLFGTFTGVKYIINLTDTINTNKQELVDLRRDVAVEQEKVSDLRTRLSSAEATWQMAENLYQTLANQVREHSYDIKDINRDLNN
jgi:septal ring factor EnvC (AmiA/AmiB activator)|tara:strand:+ start:418 stop:729 length:312 start_codon:yes stop_codon:yes gene_type:complete